MAKQGGSAKGRRKAKGPRRQHGQESEDLFVETGALAKLVAQLLVAVQGISGYPAPAAQPEIAFVEGRALQQRACGRPCEVYGWFPPGDTIYLDDRLDPTADPVARSILVHELVHYRQHSEGAIGLHETCEAWLEREWEAYDVQIRWLVEQNVPPRDWARLGLRRTRMNCRGQQDGRTPKAGPTPQP